MMLLFNLFLKIGMKSPNFMIIWFLKEKNNLPFKRTGYIGVHSNQRANEKNVIYTKSNKFMLII